MAQFRIRTIRIKGWQIFLIFALVLALFVTLPIVALGAFLILFPIFILVGAIAYLFGFGRRRAPGRDGPRRARANHRDRISRDRAGAEEDQPQAQGPLTKIIVVELSSYSSRANIWKPLLRSMIGT